MTETQDVKFGIFLVTGNSMIAEAAAVAGFDWAVIDMEAAAIGRQDALHQLQALSGSNTVSMIRVASLDRSSIEHALDIGAAGVLVPKVETAGAAKEAADWCRFPPHGHRGVNPIRASAYFQNLESYFEEANSRVFCAVQIETSKGLANAAEIAAVEGVDIVFIGAGDLAMELGTPGKPSGEIFDSAVDEIFRCTVEANKIPGIFAYSLEYAMKYREAGFKLIALGNEIKFFLSGAEVMLRGVGPGMLSNLD
ncbi:MAG: aldolase/citrate lyase family protein [Acidimicrobiales bacterium]